MAKICVPNYECLKFDSLAEAYDSLKNDYRGWGILYVLKDIVQYNVRYRDYLRENGIEAMIELLVDEAPKLRDDSETLNYLREWWSRVGRLGDYDIQCCNINDKIAVLGHEFDGLQDVRKHRTISGRDSLFSFSCHKLDGVEGYPDVHIGEIYDNYPMFDSSDYGDDRTYQNYIFKSEVITEDDLKSVYTEVSQEGNFCMAHERIPLEHLPILYYNGSGGYMLLVTSKEPS